MKDINHIDDQLRLKFSDHEIELTDFERNRFVNSLVKKEHKKSLIWLFFDAAFIIMISMMLLFNKIDSKNEIISKHKVIENKNTEIKTPNTSTPITSNPNHSISEKLNDNHIQSNSIKDLNITKENIIENNIDSRNNIDNNIEINTLDLGIFKISNKSDIKFDMKTTFYPKTILPNFIVNNTNSKPKIFNFEIYLGVGLNGFSSKLITNTQLANFLNKDYYTSIKNKEQTALGTSAMFNISLVSTSQIIYSIGLQKSIWIKHVNYQHIINEFPNVVSGKGIVSYTPMLPVEVKHSGSNEIQINQLQIGIGKRFSLNSKNKIDVLTKFNINNITNGNGTLVNPTFLTLDALNTNTMYKKWSKACNLSLNANRIINNNLNLVAGTHFEFGLDGINNSNSVINQKIRNLGFNLGIVYKLSK